MFNWLDNLVGLLLVNVFGITLDSKLGLSLHFFIYDVLKILILLSLMIFLISFIRSFSLQRKQKIL